MADYTYNDALNRLIKHLEIKNAGSYISNMSGAMYELLVKPSITSNIVVRINYNRNTI